MSLSALPSGVAMLSSIGCLRLSNTVLPICAERKPDSPQLSSICFDSHSLPKLRLSSCVTELISTWRYRPLPHFPLWMTKRLTVYSPAVFHSISSGRWTPPLFPLPRTRLKTADSRLSLSALYGHTAVWSLPFEYFPTFQHSICCGDEPYYQFGTIRTAGK